MSGTGLPAAPGPSGVSVGLFWRTVPDLHRLLHRRGSCLTFTVCFTDVGQAVSACPQAARGCPLAPVSSSEIRGLHISARYGRPPNPMATETPRPHQAHPQKERGEKPARITPTVPLPTCSPHGGSGSWVICTHPFLPFGGQAWGQHCPLLPFDPAHSPMGRTQPVPFRALADAPCRRLGDRIPEQVGPATQRLVG